MAFQVELVSPERILYSGEADMLICRTEGGDIAFLTGHAPFVGALGIGEVRVHQVDGDVVHAAVHGGFVEVRDNRAVVLSDVAELPDMIDRPRAEEALRRAEAEGDELAARRARVRLGLIHDVARS